MMEVSGHLHSLDRNIHASCLGSKSRQIPPEKYVLRSLSFKIKPLRGLMVYEGQQLNNQTEVLCNNWQHWGAVARGGL